LDCYKLAEDENPADITHLEPATDVAGNPVDIADSFIQVDYMQCTGSSEELRDVVYRSTSRVYELIH